MSTTTPASASLPPAPWKSLFHKHMSEMKPPQFVLSTVTPAPPNSNSPTPYLPRARYCIFRGFWAELPENKHNEAERNPRVYETDCPAFTTDVRMEKVKDLFMSSAGHAESEAQVQGSGGGGPVEAVWWAEETGTQWRLKGRAFVVGPDVEEGDGEGRSGVRTLKSEVGKRMRVIDESKESEWSWARELEGSFGNMSPGMRGSFKGPPPGQPVNKPYDKDNLELGSKVEDLHNEAARKNFRVVIIVPDIVEQTDISDPNTARRHRYTYGANGQWTTEELWP
ncbi:hypothetical protein BU16DRAFT_511901 [Lophium mytilinum]|uniref:Pyridoxamine 5'-phosphate oxidase Alr4036 family FMN-binding domain-containing protein n=1 Tax=Lophium mytilinum TaxID=390894 RepID=A0A6A6QP92_9PEZI|nr:hypothetical protein BU16DRAFT_511901 [Lophium mytilinum]